jgi:MFS family permease
MREHCEHFRRNYLLGLLNGAFYRLGDTLVDPSVVTAWFVGELTTSPFLLGLLMPIYKGGWFLLQLPTSHYIQRRSKHMPTYIVAATVRILSWFALALAVLLLAGRDPQLLLWFFFLFWTLASLASGVGGVPLLSIIGKVIPADRLGHFFGLRNLFGGLLGILASLVAARILSAQGLLPFPTNYSLIFGLAALALGMTFTSFALIREPEEVVPEGPGLPFHRYLTQSARALFHDRPFALYTLARCLLVTVDLAVPFYTAYAQKSLQAPVSFAGIYLTATMVASLGSNLLWSRLSRRRGNKPVLVTASAMGLAAPLIALMFTSSAGFLSRSALHYAFAVVFILAGASRVGIWIGGNSYLLEYAPQSQRPRYIGLANSAIGLSTLLGIGMGIAVGQTGLVAFFWGAAVMTLGGMLFCLRLAVPARSDSISDNAA